MRRHHKTASMKRRHVAQARQAHLAKTLEHASAFSSRLRRSRVDGAVSCAAMTVDHSRTHTAFSQHLPQVVILVPAVSEDQYNARALPRIGPVGLDDEPVERLTPGSARGTARYCTDCVAAAQSTVDLSGGDLLGKSPR